MKLSKLLLLALSFFFSMQLALADAAEGEKLFQANCVACHAIQDKVVGPALKDVHKRRDAAWLKKWIRNSQAMVKAGDPTAVQLFKEYNNVPMTAFETLTDEQITSILDYIKQAGDAPPKAAAAATTDAAAAGNTKGGANNTMLVVLLVTAVVLVIAVFVLMGIRKSVERTFRERFPEKYAEERALNPTWKENPLDFRYKLFRKHPVVGTLVVMISIFLVLGLYGFDYGNKEIGVQKGYAPVQPINYSHELHAGKYKINCLYCHSGADKGKQATIPSASTCMNCHMHVTAKDKYDGKVSPEIAKIYEAVGWDAEKKAYDPSKPKTPIKWVRVHNLPDHAYFNHAQHVKVGKVECQACHGPVETMKVVSQQRSLQMGWCINCHREAKVDVAGNAYYEKLHKDMKNSGKSVMTVAENGGLECSKCHY